MPGLFRFPDPVNEVSARLVAAGVVAMCAATLALQQPWILIPLAYGFVARVLTGPTLSPLGQLVTRVITPRLRVAARPLPGPPKRFAQGIGAVLSTTAVVLYFAGVTGAAYVLVALILVAATLESALGFCIGCRLFALLMRTGIIPKRICEACADLSRRPLAPAPRGVGGAGTDRVRSGTFLPPGAESRWGAHAHRKGRGARRPGAPDDDAGTA